MTQLDLLSVAPRPTMARWIPEVGDLCWFVVDGQRRAMTVKRVRGTLVCGWTTEHGTRELDVRELTPLSWPRGRRG